MEAKSFALAGHAPQVARTTVDDATAAVYGVAPKAYLLTDTAAEALPFPAAS